MKSFLYALFLVSACTYVALLGIGPFPFAYVLKALPALSLALLCLRFAPRFQGKVIALGLLFGAGGDIALNLDPEGYFVIGLGLFLVNHVFYTLAFAAELDRKPVALRVGLGYGMVVFGLLAYYILRPRLGALWPPVLVYLAVITLMGVLATRRKAQHAYFWLGALLFMVSDFVIAWNKFMLALPYAAHVIMVTYYLAQLSIAHGALQRERR